MKPVEIITTEEAQQGFYPTPLAVAERLLSGLDVWYLSNVLEPSAGKGDLVRALAEKRRIHGKTHALEVDGVEIDPHLRSILSYEFGGQKYSKVCARTGIENWISSGIGTTVIHTPNPGRPKSTEQLRTKRSYWKASTSISSTTTS